MELRRRAPRIKIDWLGRCRLDDEPDSAVWDCQVIDISLLGVGVELLRDCPGDLVGRVLVVDVEPPIGHSVRLQVSGQVMNQGKTPQGLTRVGLQFVGLSDTEIAVLEVIEQLRMFW